MSAKLLHITAYYCILLHIIACSCMFLHIITFLHTLLHISTYIYIFMLFILLSFFAFISQSDLLENQSAWFCLTLHVIQDKRDFHIWAGSKLEKEVNMMDSWQWHDTDMTTTWKRIQHKWILPHFTGILWAFFSGICLTFTWPSFLLPGTGRPKALFWFWKTTWLTVESW